jgi:hypothetical protein
LIDKWRPKRAFGPLAKDRFTEELWRIERNRDIQPAEYGVILGDDVAWAG